VAVKLPELFGVHLKGGGERFFARNMSLFVLPLLTRIIHDERLSVQIGDGRCAMASAVVPLGDYLTVDGA
jgi:hypothetical protein